MKTHTYDAAGGVVVYQDQVLVLNRPSRDETRLPKGHIEPGESPQEAAVRETREESGYAELIVLGDLGLQVVEFDYQNEHFVRSEYYFLMTLNTHPQRVVPVPEKQFKPAWLTWENALAAVTFEAEREWLQRARVSWQNQPG